MSYPEIFRKRALEYRNRDHTLKETEEAFKININTIREWENRLQEEGNLQNRPLNRSFKKIDPKKLKEYVDNHPDAFLKEIAVEFNCSINAVSKALKKHKITRKKKQRITKSNQKKK